MGCASSAPLMGETGALGEIKHAANDMIESGENALHDMGEAAGKTINNAVDHVKETVVTATHDIENALGLSKTTPAEESTKEDASKNLMPIKLPSMDKEDASKDGSTPPHSVSSEIEVPPEGPFKPTPVPSFEKPPTPNATALNLTEMADNTMEKIDESLANASLEQLADDLMKDTEESAEGVENEDEVELPPTKWEALADVMVELPPRMSIDMGTGQLYAVVDEEHPRLKNYVKPAILKEMSAETS